MRRVKNHSFGTVLFLQITVVLLFISFVGSLRLAAQPVPPVDERPNFYVIQQKFYEEWEKKGKDPGELKRFERWASFVLPRVSGTNGYMLNHSEEIFKAISERNTAKSAQLTDCTSNWEELGPRTFCAEKKGYGRLTFVKFYPENAPTKVFVGSGGGGIWWRDLTPNSQWTPLTDYNLTGNSGGIDISVLGVSDLAIHPTNPQIMYVATGDPKSTFTYGYDDTYTPYSMGVLKSTNGGATWTQWNLENAGVAEPAWNQTKNAIVHKLLMHPTDPNTLIAATNQGIIKTTDGVNWKINATTKRPVDIVFKPNNPSIVYGVSQVGDFYKSEDTGNTWTNPNSTNATKGARLAVIAGSSGALADRVYTITANTYGGLQGVFLSTNAGTSFTKIYGAVGQTNLLSRDGALMTNSANDTGQGGYDLALTTNATGTVLYVGGIEVWKLSITNTTGTSGNTAVKLSNVSGVVDSYPTVTTYSGTLTSTDPQYHRPINTDGTGCTGGSTDWYKYDVFSFTLNQTENLSNITISTPANPNVLLTFYSGTFDANNPCFATLNLATPNSLSTESLNLGFYTTFYVVVTTVSPTATLPIDYTLTFSKPVVPLPTGCVTTLGSTIHVDVHDLVLNGGSLYALTDGGIYKGNEIGGDFIWSDQGKGLGIRQCNGVAGIGTQLISGAQDNGVARLIAAPEKRWSEFQAGDGESCLAVSATEMYYSIQEGGFSQFNPTTSAIKDIIATELDLPYDGWQGAKIANESSNFNNRAVDFVSNKLYVGYENLYKSVDLTTTPPTFTNITASTSDEYTPGGASIDCLAIDPSDDTRKYFAVNRDLYFTDGTISPSGDWKKINTVPSSGNNAITDIVVHPTNHTVWYTCSGYNEGKKVFKMVKNGSSWTITNISRGLPNLPVNTITYGGTSKDVLYVGTDNGVYVTHNCGSGNQQWLYFNHGTPPNRFPNVVVSDLTVLKNTDGTPLKLVASTYGRGVWQSNLLTQQDVDNDCTDNCTANSLPQITPSNTNPMFVCANDIATAFNTSGTFHLDNVTFSDVDGDDIFISVSSQDDFPAVYNGISYILDGVSTTVSIDLTLSPTCTNCNIYDYVGVHHITVRAYDFLGATISEKEYTVVILCEGNEYGYTCGGSCPIWTGCPVVGFDPIISTAVVGCNGSTTLGTVQFRATSCPDLVQLTAKLSSSSNPDYNSFENPQEVLSLAGGSYSVDIYANGALFVPNYPITVPIYNHNAVNFQTLVTNTTAANAPYCNGVVSVQFIGSTLYNSFQWSNGTAGGNYQSIDHLCAGTYTVTVTDGMGCSATQSATVAAATPAVCTCGTNVIGISPNPFTGAVAVSLRLDNTGDCGVNTQEFVTIDLWNTLGVKVATIFNAKLVIGPTHTLNFNGANLASGLYYLRVKACNTPPLVYSVVKY